MIATLFTEGTSPSKLFFQKSFIDEITNKLIQAGWSSEYIKISTWFKDIEGITIDGVFYPPTNRYKGFIAAMRKDRNFYQVNIAEESEEIENSINEMVIREDFENAIETINEFVNCACDGNNNITCDKHKNL